MLLLKNMTTQKLKRFINSLYVSIYVYQCSGTRDHIWLQLAENELLSRGYELNECNNHLKFIKI